jgi:hypothetical protein
VLPESRTRETTEEIHARYKIFKERIERDLKCVLLAGSLLPNTTPSAHVLF